jgi:hypothetical protein
MRGVVIMHQLASVDRDNYRYVAAKMSEQPTTVDVIVTCSNARAVPAVPFRRACVSARYLRPVLLSAAPPAVPGPQRGDAVTARAMAVIS